MTRASRSKGRTCLASGSTIIQPTILRASNALKGEAKTSRETRSSDVVISPGLHLERSDPIQHLREMPQARSETQAPDRNLLDESKIFVDHPPISLGMLDAEAVRVRKKRRKGLDGTQALQLDHVCARGVGTQEHDGLDR